MLEVMQHTLSAIAYCHSKAVIHKDFGAWIRVEPDGGCGGA